MIAKFILFLALIICSLVSTTTPPPPTQVPPQKTLMYIGPHNLHETFLKLRSIQQPNQTILDVFRSHYKVSPILRNLESINLSDEELFKVLVKREIAWNWADFNEFGLMTCEELKFLPAILSGYIEVIPNNSFIIFVEKFEPDSLAEYIKTAEAAKVLQTKCLIKRLEKAGLPISCQYQIPFCFSDSWKQIWWKI